MDNVFKNIKRSYINFEKRRAEIIDLSNKIKRESKKIIHKVIHSKVYKLENKIKEIKKDVLKVVKMLDKNPYLYNVGAVYDGLEEYVELIFLYQYIYNNRDIDFLLDSIHHDILISGISDTSGEIVRLLRLNMDKTGLEKAYNYISVLYYNFLDLDVSRNNKLRSKIDVVYRNMIRLEEMMFDLKLKQKGV